MSQRGESESQHNLAYYCQAFSELNVNSNQERGEALYQPILLLSVIDLIAQGLIEDNRILVTEELRTTFNQYKKILSPPDKTFKSSLSLPFFHLKNEKEPFWNLNFKSNYENNSQNNEKIRKSITQLKNYVNYAYIDSELLYLIQDEESRRELVDALVAKWFTSSKNISGDETECLLKANKAFQDSIQIELARLSKSERTAPKFYFRKTAARKAVFGKAVVGLYDYKCAFCRLKVSNSLNQSIVDGAHIEPFATSFNNNITNGIAFCKNHHWAFDKGWFSITSNYKIIVADDLQEESPYARKMKEFHGENILLPDSEKYTPDLYYPDTKALKKHRKKWRFPTR